MYKSTTFESDILPSPDLKDINSVGIEYTDLTSPKLGKTHFVERLKKSGIELNLQIKDIAYIYDVTPSVISGYEAERYYPSKDIIYKLSYTFDMEYLCKDGFTHILLNYDIFLDNLCLWIKNSNLLREDDVSNL